MKRNEIRDLLNSEPLDWDKDGVWERISTEEKRKRRPVFWWWLFGAFLLLAGAIVADYAINTKNKKEAFVTDVVKESIKENLNSKHENKNTESTKEIENKKSNHDNASFESIKNELEGIDNNIEEVLSATQRKINFSSKSGISELTNDNEFLNVRELKLSNQKGNLNFAIDNKEVDYNTFRVVDKMLENRSITLISSADSNGAKPNAYYRNSIDVASLPLLIQSLGWDNTVSLKKMPQLVLAQENLDQQNPKNALLIGVGINTSRSTFGSSNTFDRNAAERNIIGYEFQVDYKRSIIQAIDLNFGVSYATYRTNYFKQETIEGIYVNSIIDNKTFVVTKENIFNLYNHFRILDLYVAPSFSFNIGQINIETAIGAGLTLLDRFDGQVVVEKESLVDFTEIYHDQDWDQLFFLSSLGLSIPIRNEYSVGVRSLLKFKRKLAMAEYEHSISPLSMQLFCSKKW